jgi:hypothetical protein
LAYGLRSKSRSFQVSDEQVNDEQTCWRAMAWSHF